MNTIAKRIDVHHHFLPPELVTYLNQQNISWTGTGLPTPEWNVSKAREMMECSGIAAAIASVVPSIYWGEADLAVKWARLCNEYVARIVQDDRQHFGGFATLPLPDVAAAQKELEYGFDELKMDGVVLFASQGTKYLGDPAYEELFQELNRRSAVVFIHPNTVPPGSDVPELSIPYTLVEFVMDTTRAITNLLYNGTFERYPAIRYIVAHAGGTVPYIASRIALGELHPRLNTQVPKGALHYLKRLYYETALSSNDNVFAALKQFVPSSQILYGSDFPMANDKIVKALISNLETSKLLDDATRNAIGRENALALFPRFGKSI